MSTPAFPTPREEGKSESAENKIAHKLRASGRSYTNFRSAIMTVRTHIYETLMVVSGMFIGTVVAVATSVLVQSASMRSHVPLDTGVMTFLLVGIAGISCLAGGLTMMNTLLTVIDKRAREISVRLAVGARQRDIRAQILWEATLISCMGGIAGCVCGLVIGFILTLSLQMPFHIHPVQIAVLVSFSVIVSIICAFYPVLRIARLDYRKVLRTS